jgi:hypothetical protein
MARLKRWRIQLQIIGHQEYLIDDMDYEMSTWATWAKRIEAGHKEEEKYLKQQQKKWEARHKNIKENADEFYQDDYLAEEYSQMCGLTNSMYGALIVSLWSEMESFLVGIGRACYWALEKKETALKTVAEFCNQSLDNTIDEQGLSSSIKKLRSLQSGIPYRINDIKDSLVKDLNIDLNKVTNYSIIDAIRILNNSFKHNGGWYKPKQNRPDTHIKQALLDKWGVKEKQEIDYSKLPIKELVIASSSFRKDLLEKVEQELANRIERGKGNS